jgi:hypothetical protein
MYNKNEFYSLFGSTPLYCGFGSGSLFSLFLDKDPTFAFNADPDPAPRYSDANP